MNKIHIPISGEFTEISSIQNFVIVGANGSGKTRLGACIENYAENGNVLRISAQRALSVPDIITLKSEEVNWNSIYYGSEDRKDKHYKWGWDDTSKMIDDYERVLSAIFARKNKENDDYVKDCKEKESLGLTKNNVPQMITDAVTSIWNSVFPHRQIEFSDAKVIAKLNSDSVYHAKKMSDGERVAIYLIGLCLIAPSETTIIIDEPEIHLHRAIMYELWDNIERFCPDKTIVYITHDLDFAASRKEATKIWVKSYNGADNWDINILPNDSNIPESLMMEVFGNRKPVLFIEGQRGSYDNQLYPYIYENFNVIPCHDCHNVIEMTKAFNNAEMRALHNYDVRGLIDRDYMTDEEILSYQEVGIYTLDVAEVENLYLAEGIIRIVARHQVLSEDEIFSQVKDFLFSEYSKEYDVQLMSMCAKEIRHRMSCYTKPKENSIDALISQKQLLCDSVDVESIYVKCKGRIDEIIANQDYNGLLKIYNRKSLHERISSIFHLGKNEYPNLVLRLLKTLQKEDIVDALKSYVPNIT